MPSKCVTRLMGALTLSGLLFVSSTSEANNEWDWYWGLGYGLSHVDPEGKARGWSTDDSSDSGYKLAIGADINNVWGFDISYHDLGSAGLGNDDPSIDQQYPREAIDYKVFSGVFNYAPWYQSGDNLKFYGKFGLSSIENKASSQFQDPNDPLSPSFDEETSVQFAVGLGLKWDVSDSIFMKTEFERFDRDAYFISLQVGGYF